MNSSETTLRLARERARQRHLTEQAQELQMSIGEFCPDSGNETCVVSACLFVIHCVVLEAYVTEEVTINTFGADIVGPLRVYVDGARGAPELVEFMSAVQAAVGLGNGPQYIDDVVWRLFKRRLGVDTASDAISPLPSLHTSLLSVISRPPIDNDLSNNACQASSWQRMDGSRYKDILTFCPTPLLFLSYPDLIHPNIDFNSRVLDERFISDRRIIRLCDEISNGRRELSEAALFQSEILMVVKLPVVERPLEGHYAASSTLPLTISHTTSYGDEHITHKLFAGLSFTMQEEGHMHVSAFKTIGVLNAHTTFLHYDDNCRNETCSVQVISNPVSLMENRLGGRIAYAFYLAVAPDVTPLIDVKDLLKIMINEVEHPTGSIGKRSRGL